MKKTLLLILASALTCMVMFAGCNSGEETLTETTVVSESSSRETPNTVGEDDTSDATPDTDEEGETTNSTTSEGNETNAPVSEECVQNDGTDTTPNYGEVVVVP